MNVLLVHVWWKPDNIYAKQMLFELGVSVRWFEHQLFAATSVKVCEADTIQWLTIKEGHLAPDNITLNKHQWKSLFSYKQH